MGRLELCFNFIIWRLASELQGCVLWPPREADSGCSVGYQETKFE